MDDRNVDLVPARSPFELGVGHLAEKILSYLPTRDVKNCRRVCKAWNDLASPLLWKSTEIRCNQKDKKLEKLSFRYYSSQKCVFSLHLQNDAHKYDPKITGLLLERLLATTIGSLTIEYLPDLQMLRRLMTELVNLKNLKASKVRIDTLPPLSITRKRRAEQSGVQSLNLCLSNRKRDCFGESEEQRVLKYILEPCFNLKELQIKQGSKSSISIGNTIDNIYEALVHPGRLSRLKLSHAANHLPCHLQTVRRFNNLQELDLLEWGRISLDECLKFINESKLPRRLTIFKVNIGSSETNQGVIMPELGNSSVALQLLQLVIRSCPMNSPRTTVYSSEEWTNIDGKLELTTAEIARNESSTSHQLPDLTRFQKLENLTWIVSSIESRDAFRATPPSVKILNMSLSRMMPALPRQLLSQEQFCNHIAAQIQPLPHLERLTMDVQDGARGLPGYYFQDKINGADFHYSLGP